MAIEGDFYELLEVERTADDGTLKSSYRKLAMRWHPDRNPGDAEAEARFKAISEAYDCLKDPQKRAAYDRFGHEAFKNGGMGGPGGGAGGIDPAMLAEALAQAGIPPEAFQALLAGKAASAIKRAGFTPAKGAWKPKTAEQARQYQQVLNYVKEVAS